MKFFRRRLKKRIVSSLLPVEITLTVPAQSFWPIFRDIVRLRDLLVEEFTTRNVIVDWETLQFIDAIAFGFDSIVKAETSGGDHK